MKDHLGNIRSVVTEEQRTDAYPMATMEISNAASDTLYYANVAETRAAKPSGMPVDNAYTNPNAYVAKVKGDGNKIGPSIMLKVMAGDTFLRRNVSLIALCRGRDIAVSLNKSSIKK